MTNNATTTAVLDAFNTLTTEDRAAALLEILRNTNADALAASSYNAGNGNNLADAIEAARDEIRAGDYIDTMADNMHARLTDEYGMADLTDMVNPDRGDTLTHELLDALMHNPDEPGEALLENHPEAVRSGARWLAKHWTSDAADTLADQWYNTPEAADRPDSYTLADVFERSCVFDEITAEIADAYVYSDGPAALLRQLADNTPAQQFTIFYNEHYHLVNLDTAELVEALLDGCTTVTLTDDYDETFMDTFGGNSATFALSALHVGDTQPDHHWYSFAPTADYS